MSNGLAITNLIVSLLALAATVVGIVMVIRMKPSPSPSPCPAEGSTSPAKPIARSALVGAPGMDMGYADCLRGWYDFSQPGVYNDFCRTVGDGSDFACVLAGTTNLDDQYARPVTRQQALNVEHLVTCRS